MDLNFNSMSSYNDKSSVANSLIFYLYHKHKKQNLYYKSVNSIQGLYKDPILKEYIYISSNGLKKNAVFKRSEINENVLSPKINIFISYFSNIEDNLFKFNLYPQKYFKDVAKHYFNQRQIIIQCQKKLLNLKIPKLKSKFLTNYIALCNIRRQTVFGGFDKLLIVKSLYQKVIVTTTTGFLKDVTLNFSERIIFTGLTYILKKNMKEAFVNILMLNYLLLKYYSNTYLNWKKNSNLLYNIVIYFNYWKYLNVIFFDYLKSKKIKFRKSNPFLKKYQNYFNNKISKFIKLYYYIAIKQYNLQTNTIWIKSFIFNKYQNIFSNNTEEVENLLLFNKINSLTSEQKMVVFKFVLNYLKTKLATGFFDSNLKLKLLNKYIYLKGFIMQAFISKEFKNLNNSFINIPMLFSQDLFFFKTKVLDNVLYPNENYIFSNTKIFGYNLLTKKTKKIKFLCKRKTFFPFYFQSEKINFLKRKDLISKRKQLLLKNNKITIFLKSFYNLNTAQISSLKNLASKKIAYKKRKVKRIFYTPLYKKLKFNNLVISQLLLNRN